MTVSNARKLDAEVGPMLRKVGQNFVMPIFSGEVDAEIVQKEDPATGPSPLTIADIGVQILVTREIEKMYGDPRGSVFGEEYVPDFEQQRQEIINTFDLEKRLSLARKDAREFIDLLEKIVKPNPTSSVQKLPSMNLKCYTPGVGRKWMIDPIDGTLLFSRKEKGFSILLAQTVMGRVVAGWIYRPALDDMYQRTGSEGAATRITYTKDNVAHKKLIKFPAIKEFSKMKVVYAHAHPNVPLAKNIEAIYCKPDGQRLSFAELKLRHKHTFNDVLPTDGYSSHICEMLKGKVDAVCVPGSQPWDHFAPAFIAQGAGYSVSFFDGRSYLGSQGQVTLSNTDPSQIEDRGGVLYCAREIREQLNNELCEKWRRARAKLPYGFAQL